MTKEYYADRIGRAQKLLKYLDRQRIQEHELNIIWEEAGIIHKIKRIVTLPKEYLRDPDLTLSI